MGAVTFVIRTTYDMKESYSATGKNFSTKVRTFIDLVLNELGKA